MKMPSEHIQKCEQLSGKQEGLSCSGSSAQAQEQHNWSCFTAAQNAKCVSCTDTPSGSKYLPANTVVNESGG